jgi:hypothetical protein
VLDTTDRFIMHLVELPLLRSRRVRRGVGLWVLAMLLLLQAQVAMAGCLLARAMPASDASAAMVSMAGCDQPDNAIKRACLQHCEQAGDAPTTSGDVSMPLLVAAVASPALAPFRVGGAFALAASDMPSVPGNGPPVYLRLLRLLD